MQTWPAMIRDLEQREQQQQQQQDSLQGLDAHRRALIRPLLRLRPIRVRRRDRWGSRPKEATTGESRSSRWFTSRRA